MEQYIAIMNLRQTQEEWIIDFISMLSPMNRSQIKIAYYNKRTEKNAFKVSEAEDALIRKIRHMMFCRGGLMPIIDMLTSFSVKGVKRIKSNQGSNYQEDDSQRYYEEKNGQYKHRHHKNLKRAHFRWDFGVRYTLSDDTVKHIFDCIQPLAIERLKANQY